MLLFKRKIIIESQLPHTLSHITLTRGLKCDTRMGNINMDFFIINHEILTFQLS